MFVMSVTTMVVINCVVVLNVSLRTPSTHVMTNNVRKVRESLDRLFGIILKRDPVSFYSLSVHPFMFLTYNNLDMLCAILLIQI